MDNCLERLDYSNMENKKPDRRNLWVEADAIRSQMLAAGNYSATLVNNVWQYNIGNDVKELPGILFTSKAANILYDYTRRKYYSVLPFEVVTFKNKNGIRMVKGIATNTAAQGADLNLFTDRTDFVAQTTGAGVAYGLLESASLTGAVGYEIEMLPGTPGVVYYNNMQPDYYSQVLFTALARLTSYSEDDMMPMDDTFAKMLEDMTVQAFVVQKQANRDKVEGE